MHTMAPRCVAETSSSVSSPYLAAESSHGAAPAQQPACDH
jgi:hypothetical protein